MTITGRVAQAVRILTKAAAYRAAIQREAAARQAREEAAERERVQRAQDEFEDDMARGLAEEHVYVPREGRGGTLPGLLTLEQWQQHGNADLFARRDAERG